MFPVNHRYNIMVFMFFKIINPPPSTPCHGYHGIDYVATALKYSRNTARSYIDIPIYYLIYNCRGTPYDMYGVVQYKNKKINIIER